MIKFDVNASKFEEWSKQVQNNIKKMDSTLFEAGLLIDELTEDYIPLDWAYLIRSYEANIFSTYPLIELEYGYTGRHSPRYKGYDYAWIQWYNTEFHHEHGESHFIEKGIIRSEDKVMKLLEKDYLSCFGVKL